MFAKGMGTAIVLGVAMLFFVGGTARATPHPTYYLVNFGASLLTTSSITAINGNKYSTFSNVTGPVGLPLASVLSLNTASWSGAQTNLPITNGTQPNLHLPISHGRYVREHC